MDQLKNFKNYVFLFLTFLVAGNLFAGKRYWIASTASAWNSTSNWSATSGGAGGSSVPGSSDTAYFDNGGLGNCNIDANVNVKRFEIKSGYTGTITQNAFTITVGTGNMVLAGGIFTGSSSAITISGDLTNSGCSFTSTSGTLDIVDGSFRLTGSGSFAHNTGLVKLNTANSSGSRTDSINITTSSSTKSLNDLEFAVSSSGFTHIYAFGSGNIIIVDRDLSFSGSGIKHVKTGTIEVKRNVTVNGTGEVSGASGAVATIKFNGTATQTLTGSGQTSKICMLGVNIDKSDTLKLSGTIAIGWDFKLTNGILSAGTSRMYVKNSGAIKFTGRFTGASSLNKLFFAGASYAYTTIDDTLNIKDSLVFSTGMYLQKGTGAGIVNAKGLVYHAGTYAISGSANLFINGSGTQTLRSLSTSSPTDGIPNLTIQKNSGDTLKLIGNIIPSGNWTYSSGILESSQAVIKFTSATTITGSHTLKRVNMHFDLPTAIAVATGSELTISDTLWQTGSSLTKLDGTVNLYGHLYIQSSGSSAVGSGTLKVNGTADQKIFGYTTDNDRPLACAIVINKATGTLYLYDNICFGYNFTYTAGTVNAGSSTVRFTYTPGITGSMTFNNLTFSSQISHCSFSITSTTTLTVNGTLKTTGASNWRIQINTGTIHAKGDIVIANPSTDLTSGGTATIIINGTGNQNFTGASSVGTGILCKVHIDKPSGTLYLFNSISLISWWNYIIGNLDPGTSTVALFHSATITGNQTLYNLSFIMPTGGSSSVISSGTTVIVNGTLTIGGTQYLALNTGTIEAKGNINITNTSTSTSGGGSATVKITGTGNQTFTGSGTAGAGYFCNLEINKPSGTLYLSSVISSNRDWTYTTGTVDAVTNSSQVVFVGNYNLDGQGTSGTMQFNKIVIGANTRTLTGELNVRDVLNIQAGATLAAGANNIIIGGSWKQAGSTSIYSVTTGSVTFDGNKYVEIIRNSGASTTTIPKMVVNKSGGSIKLNSPLLVSTSLTLTKGKIKALSTAPAPYLLELADNATLTGGSDSAYVYGTIRKTGNDAFTFPLGDTTLTTGAYHPLGISAPSVATDQFEGTYDAKGQSQGSAMVDSLEYLSTCENWSLKRASGTSNVEITIGWNSNSCNANDYTNLRVAAWDGTQWTDQGAKNLSINGQQGQITTIGAISLPYSPLPITIVKKKNKDPYAILHKKLDGGYHMVTNGRLLFRFDEEYNDVDRKLSFKIFDDWNRLVSSSSTVPVNLQKPVVYGDNRYLLNILDCGISTNGFLGNGYYLLEVTNEKNEKWYLQFKHTHNTGITCPGQGGGGG